MRSWGLSVLPALLLVGAATFACGEAGLSSFADSSKEPGAGSADAGGATGFENGDKTGAASPSLVPTDNGVILVHAAGMPAFRLCFENELDRLPTPDRDTMPDANVVGVEIGSAVRIAPLKGPPGKVWIFDEPLVRELAGKGVSCGNLLSNKFYKDSAHEMPAITTNYSKGVHLLVVRGCQAKTLVTYSKAECGQDYDENAKDGNLSILDTEVKGANRTGDELPSQVIHLSQALESARGGGQVVVSFGDVKSTSSVHTQQASGPALFGAPQSFSKNPTFDPTNDAIYADVGFRVALKNGTNAPTVVSQQSLADVQKLSAPREIPSTYYAAASNYVLLLLGAPAPKLSDGGADEDPLKKVHLLAVPVIEPKADAGTDDGGGTNDGGPSTGDGGGT